MVYERNIRQRGWGYGREKLKASGGFGLSIKVTGCVEADSEGLPGKDRKITNR